MHPSKIILSPRLGASIQNYFKSQELLLQRFTSSLRLSKDVVLCSGAGERYAYRRNPGWTLITFTNLKRPSSRLTEVKGWFSSKGLFQIYCCGKKFQVFPESFFYYWYSVLCFCSFACYSKNFFNLNLPDFFFIKTKAAEVIFFTSRPKFSPGWCMGLTHSFSESALNKESGGICFFFQHQNTGQTLVQYVV